jgi:hypothetical protein
MRSTILGMFRFSGRDRNYHNRQYDGSRRKFFERNARTGILVEHTAIQRSSKIVVQSAAGILVQRNDVIGEPAIFEFSRHPRSVTRFCERHEKRH